MNRTTFLLTLLASILALAVSTPAPAKDNPASLAQRHAAAIARGDVAAALAMYTDDAVLRAGPLCTTTACVGKAAIQKELERRVADKVRATITAKYASGNIAAVRAEIRSDTIQKAGVGRIITWSIYEAKGDKLVAVTRAPQATHPQTARFFESQKSQPPAP